MSKARKNIGWFGSQKGDVRAVYSPSREKGLGKVLSILKNGDTKIKMLRTGEVFWLDRSGGFLVRRVK